MGLVEGGAEELAMDLGKINDVLREYEPNLILQSFSQQTRELRIAFTCDGGPKEDEAFLVTFKEAVIFHVPSVLYNGRVVFRIASIPDVSGIIPDVSFDEGEFGGEGFKIFLLTHLDGTATGYYVAAESVAARWVSRTECEKVW